MSALKRLIKREKLVSQIQEIIVESLFGFGKNITPRDEEVHFVENETAEQSVFAVVDERDYLARSA